VTQTSLDEVRLDLAAGREAVARALVGLLLSPIVGPKVHDLVCGSDDPPPTAAEVAWKGGQVELGDVIRTADAKIGLRAFHCGPEADELAPPASQECVLDLDVRNDGNTRGPDLYGFGWRIWVGEDHYNGASDGPSLFPNQAGAGSVSFEIPTAVTPSAIVISNTPYTGSIVSWQLNL
jgi:hypothetical protein